jgi:hypothetical protein
MMNGTACSKKLCLCYRSSVHTERTCVQKALIYRLNITVFMFVTRISRYIRRAQVKVGLINLCKGLFSLNARIYYKLKSGT